MTGHGEHEFRYGRSQDIADRVHRAALADPAAQQEFRHNPVAHAHVKILRTLMTGIDDAMEREGIDRGTRDRVINSVLFGRDVDPQHYDERLLGPPITREEVERQLERWQP